MFKKGDRVICINDNGLAGQKALVTYGQEYTVQGTLVDDGIQYVAIEELGQRAEDGVGMLVARFVFADVE